MTLCLATPLCTACLGWGFGYSQCWAESSPSTAAHGPAAGTAAGWCLVVKGHLGMESISAQFLTRLPLHLLCHNTAARLALLMLPMAVSFCFISQPGADAARTAAQHSAGHARPCHPRGGEQPASYLCHTPAATEHHLPLCTCPESFLVAWESL